MIARFDRDRCRGRAPRIGLRAVVDAAFARIYHAIVGNEVQQ